MSTYETPGSKEHNKRLRKVLPGGVHYSFPTRWEAENLHLAKGRGSRVWDLDGNEYLDLCGKFGANILGHNDDRYVGSIENALREISAANLGTIECETAEMICAFVPSAEMVRFSLSGTDAVQNALRLARAYTGKNRFIRFYTHYHGSADNLLGGAVGDPSHPVPREFPGDLSDTLGKARGIVRDQSFLLPWNDSEVLAHVLDAHGDDVAAVLMEPVCMNGGGVWPALGYLENVRRLCDEHGVLLVFDEIITGFRMGLGGAQKHLGISPDLTTLGKAMTGGALPVSAVAGSRAVMRLYEDRRVVHGGTFNGYPLGMAAVRSTLQILQDSTGTGYLEMAKHLRGITTALLDAAERYDFRLELRGIDACGIFHFAEDGPSHKQSQLYPLMLLGETLAQNGILASNLNRLYGNLSLTSKDEEFFAERIENAFESVSSTLRKLRA